MQQSVIKIDELEFVLYISHRDIQSKIDQMAAEINAHYGQNDLTIFVIMNGAFMFAADLIRHLQANVNIHFVKVKSYEGLQSTGQVDIALPEVSLANKDVLIIEDIIDTGKSMHTLMQLLEEKACASLKVASLLSKPSLRQHEVQIDYLGFEIPDKFVIGYGLDYNDQARQYKDIYQLRPIVK